MMDFVQIFLKLCCDQVVDGFGVDLVIKSMDLVLNKIQVWHFVPGTKVADMQANHVIWHTLVQEYMELFYIKSFQNSQQKAHRNMHVKILH